MSTASKLVESIEAVASADIAAAAAGVDRNREFPADGIDVLREIGGLALMVPIGDGGSGGGLASLARACESLGGACASTAMVFLMHSVAAATLAAGRGPVVDEAVRAIADGGSLATLAFSERGTGARFYSPDLRATPSNGGVRVSGRKSFVTSGGHAQLYVVLLQADGDEGLADAYVVDAAAPGLRFDGAWDGLGMTGNASVAADFDGVAISDTARLGDPGAGGQLVFSTVAPLFLVGLAAVNVGIAGAATAAAIAHASSRRFGDGTSLGEVPPVQDLLARMHSLTQATRLLVLEAARLGDSGDEQALVAIMEGKVAATEASATVSQWALEVTGGQGYTRSLPIERHLRDARAGAVMAPTNTMLRSWIGKSLVGLPLP